MGWGAADGGGVGGKGRGPCRATQSNCEKVVRNTVAHIVWTLRGRESSQSWTAAAGWSGHPSRRSGVPPSCPQPYVFWLQICSWTLRAFKVQLSGTLCGCCRPLLLYPSPEQTSPLLSVHPHASALWSLPLHGRGLPEWHPGKSVTSPG